MELTPTQKAALAAVHAGENVLVVGPGGAGKSHWISQVVKTVTKKVVPTATTGVAAFNNSGTTLHSFLGCGLVDTCAEHEVVDAIANLQVQLSQGADPDQVVYNQVLDVEYRVSAAGVQQLEAMLVQRVAARLLGECLKYQRRVDNVREAKVLLVDEVSMMSRFMLEVTDQLLRLLRQHEAPWGGLQVILVGDFRQLPPVSKEVGTITAQYAFESPHFNQLVDRTFVFTTIFRQADLAFQSLLNRMSEGQMTAEDHAVLASRIRPLAETPTDITRLFGTNDQVRRVNAMRLAEITGVPTHRYEMVSRVVRSGRLGVSDVMLRKNRESCIADEMLEIKVGAYVMLLVNLATEHGLVNGTCMRVVGVSKHGAVLAERVGPGDADPPRNMPAAEDMRDRLHKFEDVVLTRLVDYSSRQVVIHPNTWVVNLPGGACVQHTQMPLKLAWAVTIHKSQGQSYTRACIGLGKRDCFQPGAAYVAASRLQTLDGMYLTEYEPAAVVASPEAVAWYDAQKAKVGDAARLADKPVAP